MSILYYLPYIIIGYITSHHIILYICLCIQFYIMCDFHVCLSCISLLFCVMYDFFFFSWYDMVAVQSYTVITFHILSHAGWMMDLWNVCSVNVNVYGTCWLVTTDDKEELASSIFRSVKYAISFVTFSSRSIYTKFVYAYF